MKVSNIIVFVVFAIAIAIAFSFSGTFVDNEVSTALPTDENNTYAAKATDNSWPNIDESQTNIASDLSTKNYYLVFDGSGSMEDSGCSNRRNKINVAKESVTKFISKIPDDANIGLVVFDTYGTSERTLLGESSKVQAIKAISKVEAGGGTPLKSSIAHAYKSLSQQAQKQLGYGEYHLVVITDGEASGGEDPGFVVREMINKSPVVLHTIGFCIGGGHPLNQPGLTIYKAANNPQELDKGLDSVLAEATDFDVDTFEGQAQ